MALVMVCNLEVVKHLVVLVVLLKSRNYNASNDTSNALNLEVITRLVVLVMLFKSRNLSASNGTSNGLEPRSCKASSGSSGAFET
jgi:hypothetical protein